MLRPTEFIDQLQIAVKNSGGDFSVASTEKVNDLENIVVRSRNGAEIFIEMKDAKTYGELPLSTAIQLKEIKARYPKVLLVSFSKISDILSKTLDQMGIMYLTQPSVEDTTQKLTEISGSGKH